MEASDNCLFVQKYDSYMKQVHNMYSIFFSLSNAQMWGESLH